MVKTRQQKRAQAAQQTTSSSATPSSQPPSTAPPPQAPPTHLRPAVTNAVLPSIKVHPSATGGQYSPMSNAAQYGDDIVDYEEMALRELNSPRDSPENAAYARRDQSVEPFPDIKSEADSEIRASRQASFESLQRRQAQDLHDDYSPRLPLPEAGVPDGRNARPDDDNGEVPAPALRPLHYDSLPSFEELARSPVYRRASLVDSEVNYGRAGAGFYHTLPTDASPQGQYNPEPAYGYQPPAPLQYNPEPAYGYQPPGPVQLPPFGELLANVDPQYQHPLRQVEDAERRAHEAREEANNQINAAEEYAHDNLVQRQTLQARMHTLKQELRNCQGLLHDHIAYMRQRDVQIRQQQEELRQARVREQERDEQLRQAQAREEALQAQNAEREEQIHQERAQALAREQQHEEQLQQAATLERELRRDIRIGDIDNRTLHMTIDHAADVRGLRHAMADHDDQIRGHADQLQQHGQQMGQLDQEMVDVEDRLGNLEEMVHGGRGAFRGRGRQVGSGESVGPVRNERVTSCGSP